MPSTHDRPGDEIPPPSWSFFREAFEKAPAGRSDAWRTAGLWAVERLRERLGDDWPERAWQQNRRLPCGMAWAGSHTVAYAELVELALQLELLCDCEGFARVRDTLQKDPREQHLYHSRLQLEIGALADRAGYAVRFERPIPGSSRSSDVTIDSSDGTALLVEARVLLPDNRTVAIDDFTERAFTYIHNLESHYGVRCDGEFTQILNSTELAELLDTVDTHCRLVRAGAIPPPICSHHASLVVSRRAPDTPSSRSSSTASRPIRADGSHGLGGPRLEGDLWPRIADRLAKKARQTQGGENVWLRLCALQGLWLVTDWATRSLQQKLATMRHNISTALAQHAHVDGVVISSGCGWPQTTIVPEEFADELGGYAMRCQVPPIRARETLIVPLNPGAQTVGQALIWRDLYSAEEGWLDTALAGVHLPAVADLFPPSAPGTTSP
jgi:hypothetical protein